MTPLPAALGGTGLVAWRLETTRHFSTWHTAQGAFLVGGRWSSAGHRVIYTSLDPSTAIIEVGVHKGLDTLDTVPHTLLEIAIGDPAQVHVVDLATHPLVVLPSVVSSHSWNVLIDVARAVELFTLLGSEHFALDPRLNPRSVPRKTRP